MKVNPYKMILFIIGLFIGSYLMSLFNDLLFNILAATSYITIAFIIFVIVWNSRELLKNHYLLFLSMALLFVGMIDFIHALAYKGMGVFQESDINLPMQLWTVGRYIESLSFLIAPLFITRKVKTPQAFIIFTEILCLSLILIFYGNLFPACYVEGVGTTFFKKTSEIIVSLILIASLALLYQKRKSFDRRVLHLFVLSIALTLVSGLTFLSSFHLFGLSPIGYVLKVISIYLIYRTTAITGLTKPDYLLFKNLRQSEDALRKAHDEMENRVRERTAQIMVANEQLRREIKDRERTEEALRESEKRFRLLVESVKDYAIFMLDPRGHIISWNVGAERIHGYQSEEILGQPISVFYTDRDKKLGKPEETLKTAMAEGRYEGQGWRVKKNGSRFWGEMVITELRDKAGVLRGFAKVARDITARKLAENALRESEERMRELFDSAPVGYHELDLKGHIVQVNQTELGMLGYTAKEMIGQPVWKFIVEEDQFHEAMMAKLAKGVLSSKALEHNFKRKDGTSFPALIEDRILKDSVGIIKGIRSTLQDITELKKAEEEMASLQEQFRQSQKMEAIGRLAGGIAHDFNNLLTIIKGYSQLSLMELTEDHPLKGSIEEISKASDRASGLTRQLLAFSRRQILEVKVLDFNALLRDLEKMLHRILGEDIELATFLSEDLARVKADPGQIEQVIMNLAVNARDAMSSGGKLTIETKNVELDQEYARSHVGSKPGHYVMISASDTGVGMPSEIKERIFEPFFTTKEKGKGTGLGLSTVYGIVKQSKGNIWVYSEPGYGTTFKIYLPQVDEPLEALKDKLSEKALVGGNETILVVEDEEEVRKLTVRILQNKGYRVLTASDGNAALLVVKRYVSPIHLMLTDVVMPGINGRELAKKMESFHPKMKVLYMSGYTENAIVHHGILDEKMDYIPKPFTVEGLTKKVREALDK